MPIRPRGELPDPRITAVRDCYSRPASTTITTDVYIELSIDAPNCQLYFTTDGSRPVPFKRWMGTREVTFHYKAPFALKSGKRVVRAVAVSSDKLLESKVVSKTFVVHGDDYYDTIDSDLYSDDEYTSYAADLNWDSTARNRGRTRHSYTSDSNWDSDTTCRSPARQTWVPCKSWTKGRRQSRSLTRPTSAGEPEWIASTRRYPYLVETVDDEPPTDQRAEGRIPEGPFNPVNYSGTQINVWGAAPGSVWPATPGMVTYPSASSSPSGMQGTVAYPGVAVPSSVSPLQTGLLSGGGIEQNGATDGRLTNDNRPLTVAEARRIISESEAEASASASASEQSGKNKKKSRLRSGNVSFSGSASSVKGLLSSYNGKKSK